MLPPVETNLLKTKNIVNPPAEKIPGLRHGANFRVEQNAPMDGDAIKKVRNRANVTLEQLAELTGISVSVLSRLERNQQRLRLDHIEMISKALKVTPAVFFEEPSVVPLMGYVGAGAEVLPALEQVPDDGLEQLALPFPVPDDVIAFMVRGESMMPFYEDGDVILVYREPRVHAQELHNKPVMVRLEDGRRLLKTLYRDGDSFTLLSWNSHPIPNAKIEWIGQLYGWLPASHFRV